MRGTTRGTPIDEPRGNPRYFVTGGTLAADAPSYVERAADSSLGDALLAGEFCYVLDTRQMGKSSLIVRISERLYAAGITVGQVDLTALGASVTPEQWYFGLLTLLAELLDIVEAAEELWHGQSALGPAQRCFSALVKAILGILEGPVVIFIDEIDATLGLPFSADEFFGGIRYCYNRRAHEPDYSRLTFCLVGVASPADLVREPRLSPFNIGRRIELSDFTVEECAPLAQGLGERRIGANLDRLESSTHASPPGQEGAARTKRGPGVVDKPTAFTRRTGLTLALMGGRNQASENADELLNRALYWTNGHPYMTQRLCAAISTSRLPLDGPREVDALCRELFLTPEARDTDTSLAYVSSRLLSSPDQALEVLDVYDRVLRGERIPYRETGAVARELLLSGLVRVSQGSLAPRNRIFSYVFNRAWVRASMPDAEVRRQTRAYRRGVLRATLVSAAVVLVFAALAVANARNARRARDAQAVANSAAIVAQARTDYANHLVYDFSVNRAMQWYSTDGLAMMGRQLDQARPAGAEKDLRGFEWYYLRHVCHGYLREFPRQRRGVGGIAESPDGKYLATANDNAEVFVWTLAGGKLVFSVHLSPNDGRVTIAWSPDGRRLAIGAYNGSVHVLDTAGWSAVRQFQAGREVITSLTHSHSGALLITSSNDGTARLWDSRTFREIRHVTAAVARGIWSVAISPDDKILATGGDDGVARLWDIATGRPLRAMHGHSWYIYSVAFSPDGKTLATASGDATAILWNVATGSQISVLRGHTSYIYSLAFSPDGKTLATGAWDHTVRLWDAHTGAPLRVMEHTDNVWSVAFCMHGSAIAVGCSDGVVRLWSVTKSQLYRELAASTTRVYVGAYSADAARFVTYADDGVIRIWDSHSGALLHTLPRQSSAVLGAYLAGDVCRILSDSGGVTDINVTGNTITTVLRPSPGRRCAGMSVDGRLVVEAAPRGNAVLRRVGDSSPPVPLADYCPYQRYLFSPSGAQVAFQSQTGCMEICDTHTGRVAARSGSRLPDLTGPIAFSHDGRLLTGGDRGGQIYIWNARTGRLLNTIFGGSIITNTAAFSAEDMRLVTGTFDGSLTIWDTATWHTALTVATQGAAVSSVSISPDGRQIVTGDSAGRVRIWDAPQEAGERQGAGR